MPVTLLADKRGITSQMQARACVHPKSDAQLWYWTMSAASVIENRIQTSHTCLSPTGALNGNGSAPNGIGTPTDPECLVPTSSPSRNLWERAARQLSDKSRKKLTALGFTEQTQVTNLHRVKDLIGVVHEKEETCKQKKWKVDFAGHEIIVGDYAVKTATWLQKLGDIVIPFAPPQASLPWGLVKSILQIPINANEQMLAVLATTEKVVQVVFHCQVYESVYNRDQLPEHMLQALHDALIAVYKAVLELLLCAKHSLSQSTLKQFMRSILSPSDGLFSSVESEEAKLREIVQSCDLQRSADVDRMLLKELHVIQAPIARIDFRIEACFQKMDKMESLALLEWISNEPFTTYHESIKEKRTKNTGEWFLQHQDFRQWEDSSSSAVLWLRGLAGVGKSYLASKVIDHVKDTLSQGKNHEGFAFYYCSRNNDRRREPLSVLRSFVRQLPTTSNDPYSIQKSLQEICESRRLAGANLDMATCKGILLESLNLFPKTTLVLDALDECDSATRGVLVTFLDGLLSAAENPVKVFVVSRPDEDIRNQFLARPNIEIQADNNHADIKMYLNARILELAQSNRILLGWKNQITTRLLENCDGM
ncbi:NACHT nucleoside triphosphatase [Penicillium herquei]|nr:NACHT nucleoside triphosphatase [Penicillium herquei]